MLVQSFLGSSLSLPWKGFNLDVKNKNWKEKMKEIDMKIDS